MSNVVEDAGEIFPARVGDRLRSARDAKGLTVEEVARETRVPSRHLETIESGDLSRLPAAPYSAGFIKAYARVVGLDEAELSRAFRDELADADIARIDMDPFEPADPSRIVPRTLAWAALLIAVLIVAGYAVWRSNVGGDAETRAQLAAGTTPPSEAVAAPGAPPFSPATAVAAPVPSAAPADGPLVLTALAPVWLRVYERGGKTLYMGELAEGQRYELPAGAVDPLIRTGRSEFLRVTIGGTAAPSLGPPASIISDVSLRPATLGTREPATATEERPRPRRRPRPRTDEAQPQVSSDPVIPALPPSGAPLTRP